MTRRWHQLTDSERQTLIAEARRMREVSHLSWGNIARTLGVYEQTLRSHLDTKYETNLKAKKRVDNGADARVGTQFRKREQGRPHAEEVAERLAAVPADPRTITQRFAGDPLPGRSALDRREAAQRRVVVGLFG